MTEFVKRYYAALGLALILVVGATVVYGFATGVVAVVALVIGAIVGYNYMAEEVKREMQRVAEEMDEKPFPFM